MLGVLVVVLGRDPITCLEFSLGQSHVAIIASSRVVRTLGLSARRSRWRPLWAASKWPLLVSIHVSLPAMVHGSPLMEMKRSKLRSKTRPGDSTAFFIHEERMLAGRQDSQNRLQCMELVLRTW